MTGARLAEMAVPGYDGKGIAHLAASGVFVGLPVDPAWRRILARETQWAGVFPAARPERAQWQFVRFDHRRKPSRHTMHEAFDPYYCWLAIPATERPPTHYQLLGLRHLEADTHIIAKAVRLRIAHVRQCAGDLYPEQAAQLLREIMAAGETLLDPARKAQYDASLGGVSPAEDYPQQPGQSPFPAIVPDRSDRRKQYGWLRRLTASMFFVCLVLGAAVVWLERFAPPAVAPESGNRISAARNHGSATPNNRAASDSPAKPPGKTTAGQETHGRSGGSRPRSRGPRTLADLMQQADPASADLGTLTGRLAAARLAMFQRDLATASEHLAAARRMARTRTEQDETARVEQLLGAIEGFWNSVQNGLAHLDGGVELILGAERVMVVEADRSHLVLHTAGENRTFRPAELPAALAVVIARQGFTADQRSFDLQVGAFHAIDKYGDRFEARRRLGRAGSKGQQLLAELALAPEPQPYRAPQSGRRPLPLLVQHGESEPGGPVASSPEATTEQPAAAPSSGTSAGRPANATGAPTKTRLAVPGDEQRARAEQQVRSVFGNSLQQLNTAEEKRSWASRLLQMASSTDDDPAAAYVLYQMACKLAVEAADLNLSMQAADELGEKYQLDPFLLKADILEQAWESVSARSGRALVGSRAAALIDGAVAAGSFQAADRLIRLARRAARATNNLPVLRQLDARARQIEQRRARENTAASTGAHTPQTEKAGHHTAAPPAPAAEKASPGDSPPGTEAP